jgi:hypothetical protein
MSIILALTNQLLLFFTFVLPYPDENEKIVHAIVDLSDRIIVLTKKSQEILTSHYGCPIANPSNSW